MVEDVTSAAQERCGDGFKLYAEIYALRLGYDPLDPSDPSGLRNPLAPVASATGCESDRTEPPTPARRTWSRPWR